MSSPSFPAPPESMPATPLAEVDSLVQKLAANKGAWAKTTIAQRVKYLEALRDGVQEQAEGWVLAMNRVKGIDPTSSLAGEDWLGGPMTTARNIRLLIDALKAGGQPKPPALTQRKDGQWVARVMPANLDERLLFTGWSADVWIEPGKEPTQPPRS